MTTTVIFDTLQFVKKAELAGFTQRQAEFQAEVFGEMFNEKLATKQDLKHLEKTMKESMKALEEKIVDKITIRVGYMLIGAVVLLPVLFKLINLI